MENHHLVEKIILVKGLLLDCPFDKPVEDCPVNDLADLSMEERLECADNMDESMLNLIISHHKYCFQKRRLEALSN